MNHDQIMTAMRGNVTVSCQAYPGEPMRDPRTMTQMAQAVVAGGAAAVRAQGLDDIRSIVAAVQVPVVGLWKDGADGVFITPTLEHALAVAEAGAHVVALDGTRRQRPDGLSLADTIRELRAQHNVLIMADSGSLDDAKAAEDAGADFLGTTLAGYTGERPKTLGVDFDLVAEVVAACSQPVVVEGRIRTPDDVTRAFELGAFNVCVGTAITHPTSITGWFVNR